MQVYADLRRMSYFYLIRAILFYLRQTTSKNDISYLFSTKLCASQFAINSTIRNFIFNTRQTEYIIVTLFFIHLS